MQIVNFDLTATYPATQHRYFDRSNFVARGVWEKTAAGVSLDVSKEACSMRTAFGFPFLSLVLIDSI